MILSAIPFFSRPLCFVFFFFMTPLSEGGAEWLKGWPASPGSLPVVGERKASWSWSCLLIADIQQCTLTLPAADERESTGVPPQAPTLVRDE